LKNLLKASRLVEHLEASMLLQEHLKALDTVLEAFEISFRLFQEHLEGFWTV